MRGRNLRVLIVEDDDRKLLRNQWIDNVSCVDDQGGETDHLSKWTQHIRWYIENRVPEYDLLLIDINFNVDRSDPDYFLDDLRANPFGLLHALPLAARQHRGTMPFAWVIASINGPVIESDPVAIFSFGLLWAMERRPIEPTFYIGRDTTTAFREAIGQLKPCPPAEIWSLLLGRYRTRLLKSVSERALEVDLRRLALQHQLAIDGSTSALGKLMDSAIILYSGYEREEISMRSLFADYSFVDGAVRDGIRQYLTDLHQQASEVDIFEEVVEIIKELDRYEQRTLNQLLDSHNPRRALVATGVIVCVWLEEYAATDTKVRSIQITDRVRLQQGQVQQILADAGFRMSLGAFLERLDTTTLPLPSLFDCGSRYWHLELSKKLAPVRRLPKCLQEVEFAEK